MACLIGLLLPAINSAREAGRRTQCTNNITQIALAMVSYESANRSFPPGRMGCDAYTSTAPCLSLSGAQRPGTSAFLAILPQLDDAPTYSLFAPLALRGRLSRPCDFSSNWGSYVAASGARDDHQGPAGAASRLRLSHR